jgi:fructose/tagatose bisphosphate aldolase
MVYYIIVWYNYKYESIREYIKEAEDRGIAIGHFNISNIEALHGIYNAS